LNSYMNDKKMHNRYENSARNDSGIINIVTPERFKLRYRLSSPLSRLIAYFIDLIILSVIVFLTSLAIVLLYLSVYSIPFDQLQSSLDNQAFSGVAIFLYFLISFLLQWGYFIFMEYKYNGTTPGKSLMSIRVVSETGGPLELSDILIRNLVRYIDGIGTLMIAGLLSVVFVRNFKRLGDIAGGTIVVRDVKKISNIPNLVVNYDRSVGEVTLTGRLSENELFVLREFIKNYDKFSPEKQSELAINLSRKIRAILNDDFNDDLTSRNKDELNKDELNKDTRNTDPYQYLLGVYRGHENE